MTMRLWPMLACWALSLLVLRSCLIGPLPHGGAPHPGVTTSLSSTAPEGARGAVEELLSDLEALAERSYYAHQVDVRTSELLAAHQTVINSVVAPSGQTVPDDARAAHGVDAQVARPSDGFLKQPRRSRVPMMLPSEELFCDQFANTFPTPFGSDVPVETVDQWCRRGLVAESEGDHLPPGVDDGHIVQFTMLQMYRRLYFAAQFQDRLTRYRELFRPMIEAVEKRHDRMLYNYI
jgi:hypothetical protein